MEYLFEGVKAFNDRDFEEHRALFQKIGRKQEPHTLFIGCSDSRIVPNLITQTLPGELFVIRNIANLVPMFRLSDEFLSTTSAIEYAVKILNVENILICGHSNCGGCNALFLEPGITNEIPHTRHWLELAKPVAEKIMSMGIEDPAVKEWMAEQMNIVEQMNHLLTYPYINDLYAAGKINILGWYYIIETGEIFNYNKENGTFEKIS